MPRQGLGRSLSVITCRLQRPHPLLEAAKEDNRPRLEDRQLAAEAPALLFEVDDGRLPEDDAVDSAADRRRRRRHE